MQKIYVDSRSRVSGTTEEFEFVLPYSITIPSESVMVVDSVAIPNSILTVDASNSAIYVQESDGFTTLWCRAMIPHGFYDVISICAAIDIAMNTDRLLFASYTCAYDTRIGRFVITNIFTFW